MMMGGVVKTGFEKERMSSKEKREVVVEARVNETATQEVGEPELGAGRAETSRHFDGRYCYCHC